MTLSTGEHILKYSLIFILWPLGQAVASGPCQHIFSEVEKKVSVAIKSKKQSS